MDENENEQMNRMYEIAATLVAEMFTSTLAAMDKNYVGFVLDNKGIKLPVEEVAAVTKLIADVQYEIGWCYCGECFDRSDEGDDDE